MAAHGAYQRKLAAALAAGLAIAACAPGQTSVPTSPQAASPTPPPLAGAYLFYEDFEHGTRQWTLPSAGTVGWRLLESHSCGGDYTALFGADKQAPFSNVATSADLTLAKPLDLTKAVHPWLTYQVLGSSEPAAALTLQAQIDAGDGHWQSVGQPAQGGYEQMGTLVVDLAPYVGKTIGLRFHAECQATATAGKGMQLDDVAIIETGTNGGN